MHLALPRPLSGELCALGYLFFFLWILMTAFVLINRDHELNSVKPIPLYLLLLFLYSCSFIWPWGTQNLSPSGEFCSCSCFCSCRGLLKLWYRTTWWTVHQSLCHHDYFLMKSCDNTSSFKILILEKLGMKLLLYFPCNFNILTIFYHLGVVY